MAVYEIECDQSDQQYDLLRDGRPVGYALADYYMVADRLRALDADKDDIIDLPNGDHWSVRDFLAENGWHAEARWGASDTRLFR